MKRLPRAPAVQRLLARLLSAYMELTLATLRWRIENGEVAAAGVTAPEGAVVLFWHGCIAQAIACRPLLKDRPRRALISLSRDGAFIAMAAERLGFPAIRGSTARGGDIVAKGGADAFRQVVDCLAAGEIVLVTPDGPRGPRQVLSEGAMLMAQVSGAPVYLLGLAARPSLQARSWDRARIPLPFARAVAVFDGPLRAPRDGGAEKEGLARARGEWQERLIAAQSRAEVLLAVGGR